MKLTDPEHAALTLVADDVRFPGLLVIQAANPGPTGQQSGTLVVRVQPRIDTLTHEPPGPDNNPRLNIVGGGYSDASRAWIDDSERHLESPHQATNLTVVLDPSDILAPQTKTVTITNPYREGGASEPKTLPPIPPPTAPPPVPSGDAATGQPT